MDRWCWGFLAGPVQPSGDLESGSATLTFTERLLCFRPSSKCFTALLLCKLDIIDLQDIIESDFAGGETEAQSIKCLAQVQMLLGDEFSPVGLLHETIFSPIVTVCSLSPSSQYLKPA